jgi:hypothetical protein
MKTVVASQVFEQALGFRIADCFAIRTREDPTICLPDIRGCQMFGNSVGWYPVVSCFKSQRACGRINSQPHDHHSMWISKTLYP